jgi:hypothetical protein
LPAFPAGFQVSTDRRQRQFDIELVIAVDVSYSMDLDEVAVQREGYAPAIVSKDFLQAIRTGPHSKVAVTYFEWSASSDGRAFYLFAGHWRNIVPNT